MLYAKFKSYTVHIFVGHNKARKTVTNIISAKDEAIPFRKMRVPSMENKTPYCRFTQQKLDCRTPQEPVIGLLKPLSPSTASCRVAKRKCTGSASQNVLQLKNYFSRI